MSDIEIEIDGKKLKTQPNRTIIQVADEADIYIPRFCYHKHLTIAANCRMCLVEVEKSAKPLPACATPVMDGMKVLTRSAKALAAQKAVMEFLLVNHPLDCPICDQGGECELQDLSMGYGSPESYFSQGKRSVADKDIGPLIATDMTRCIQCTRCVRFGDEIAGLRELGATGRGEHMEIGTYVQHAMHSEVSGNIIDLCPVGALTSKPFRFRARAWELDQAPSIAPHDCVGSNINVHTRYGKVMRVVSRENAEINETWISDRDRYSYEGLYHPDRLAKPMVRINNQLQETTWEHALQVASQQLQTVFAMHSPDELGALVSPSATTEEFYLLQKLMRQLGSHHIDHRLRQVDDRDQAAMPIYPGLNHPISELEQYERIILIGSNIQKEQPSAALRIRKASLKGTEVIACNMIDYRFHFKLAEKKITAPQHFVQSIADLSQDKKISDGKKTCILLGAAAFNHPDASTIRALAAEMAKNIGANLGFLTEGANSAGAWMAGAVPHRTVAGEAVQTPGLSASAMLKKPRKAYILLNVEPDLDCADSFAANLALQNAQCVIALSMFKNPQLEKHAQVILPIAPFTETAGTFINAAGEWLAFRGTALPFGESRPAWKVLRVLGNFLHLSGFDYESADEIMHEIKSLLNLEKKPNDQFAAPVLPAQSKGLHRIADVPLYAIDSLVRRSDPLQATQPIIEGELASIRLHPKTAKEHQLNEADIVFVKQGQNKIQLPVIFDERVPVDAASIAAGIEATVGLSELFGVIEISRD